LFGDGGVRNIVDQLRRELGASVASLSGGLDSLVKLGISAQVDGKLSAESTAIDAALTADFDSVGELFASDDVGIAVRLDALLEPYLQTQGVFDSRTASLKSSIESINDRREALSTRLTALQARYTKQFNALDSLLAQLQGTSNFLSQQLSQLPGSTFKNS
jgi:flagellar hook-associated protein 2